MTAFDDRIRARVEAITERTGSRAVTYRRVTRTSGPTPVQNPPIGSLSGWTAQASATVGANSVPIAAGSGVIGRMIAGDTVAFPTHGPYTLASAATAVAGVFTPTFTSTITENVTLGDAVTAVWAADTEILARISGFPRRFVDGTLILATDLMVIVPGTQLATAPAALLDQLVIGGVIHIIISAQPSYAQTQVGLWNIQARVA